MCVCVCVLNESCSQHDTAGSTEYDIVVSFTKRDNEQYICRTVRSIQHRARYTNLYLSFSGVDGPELESLRNECPELRGVPTAVYTEEQMTAVREIIDYVGPTMKLRYEQDQLRTSEGPIMIKMNSAQGNVPQVRLRLRLYSFFPLSQHHTAPGGMSLTLVYVLLSPYFSVCSGTR